MRVTLALLCSVSLSAMPSLAASPNAAAPPATIESTQSSTTTAPAAGPHRCVNAQGETIYTDADCGDIDAIEKPLLKPSTGSLAGFAKPVITHACARNAEDLQWSLRSAIEKRDVNQLAGLYDWAGFGGETANQVLDRLKLVADGALMSVELLYPTRRGKIEPSSSGPAPPGAVTSTSIPGVDPSAADTPPMADPGPESSRDPRPKPGAEDIDLPFASVDYQAPPWGVVVYQSGKDNAPARSTRFQITRSHGCLWLRF